MKIKDLDNLILTLPIWGLGVSLTAIGAVSPGMLYVGIGLLGAGIILSSATIYQAYRQESAGKKALEAKDIVPISDYGNKVAKYLPYTDL